jgi:hypothetical protein
MVAAHFMVKTCDTEARQERSESYPRRAFSVKPECVIRDMVEGVWPPKVSWAGGEGGGRVRDDGRPARGSPLADGS